MGGFSAAWDINNGGFVIKLDINVLKWDLNVLRWDINNGDVGLM